MKRVAIIIMDGKEVEIESLTAKQKSEIANELNQRALAVLGYQQVKTARDKVHRGKTA